ncbi:MAG: hypothetical protein A2857_05285 [Candidatus Levybacteria bacterium RIFCSPHIGHO2_01_FULL_36_15]|nr:MAG: hypothetical protein A2857_05285 [Candidatus Levybacteria bacterium RIFCSPHIGHO2_01_FULL_36_15]OGH38469.1 MAG: hypothetical protein A2905_01540 [Candidatus Levybacteria bacterium RIFCSPLOWO2_01_FULL_36_10]
MNKIAIVILDFNGEKDTLDCLGSIENLKKEDNELFVVVVDNASKEKFSIGSFQFTKGKLKIIRSEISLGFSGGNNIGIKHALKEGATHIVILNNDTTVSKNFIDELLKTIDSSDNIGIVSPKIYFSKGFEYHKSRYKKEDLGKVIWYAGGIMDWSNLIGHHKGVDEVDHDQFEKIEETEFASGCCMMIKRDVLEKVGLFNEKYFLYYEDNDLCQRVKKIGYKIVFAPKSVIWHKNAGSSGGSGSSLQDYYITRNRLVFGFKYAPTRTKFSLIKESVNFFLNGRKWQKKGVMDFYLRRFGKGSYSL